MRLVKAKVTNFRSVEDSGEVEIGQQLCLVGKNEAGKTAILQALAGLNPHPATAISFEVERDYPRRHLTEYDKRHDGNAAVVVTTTWQMTEDEIREIVDEFGNDSLSSHAVVVTRTYNGAPQWMLPINYPAVIQHLLDAERLNAQERKALAEPKTTDDLRRQLEALPERNEKQQRVLDRLNAMPGKNATGKIIEILSLPHFMYFAHYDRMVGQLRLDTFEARENGEVPPPLSAGEQVFVDFLDYAGTSLEEIMQAATYEGLNARCEAASNRITDQLQEYWTQNPNLEIDVRVTRAEPKDSPPFNEGVIARARVKNNLHRVTVPFSERSAGFIWFFSFLVKFAQVSKDGGDLILLLDEPGLTLHGKAQADLLRYFSEKLAPHHQVIFSTHSPFMVPANDLPSVRIVEDKVTSPRPGRWESEGTKVRDDTLATDRDTLFPLQGALGYEITQTLFVGKHTLLVEGPGDILFLETLSSALERRGRERLDRRWTICPAGGIDKIQPFVVLFSGAKLNIAALTDYAKSDRRKMEGLKQNRTLEGERLLTFASLLRLEEADVEDIFVPALYLEIVNASYALDEKHRLTLEKLAEVDIGTHRLVKKVEALFKLLPPESPEFDHYTPAEWLIRHPELLDGEGEAVATSLRAAETVIATVNGLLK